MKILSVASLGLNAILIVAVAVAVLLLETNDEDPANSLSQETDFTPEQLVTETDESGAQGEPVEFNTPVVAATALEVDGKVEEIPALPGLGGFNVANPMVARSETPAVLLAEEERDWSWAPGMETQLVSEIQTATAGAPVTMMDVQCRTSWCGVVIGLPPGEDRHTRMQIGDHLREEFEFQRISRVGFGRRDGSSFIAVYLKADREPH